MLFEATMSTNSDNMKRAEEVPSSDEESEGGDEMANAEEDRIFDDQTEAVMAKTHVHQAEAVVSMHQPNLNASVLNDRHQHPQVMHAPQPNHFFFLRRVEE